MLFKYNENIEEKNFWACASIFKKVLNSSWNSSKDPGLKTSKIKGSLLNNFNSKNKKNSHSPGELKHGFELSKPKVIFVSESAAQTLINLQKSLSFIKQIILFDNHSTHTITLKSFIASNSQESFDVYKQVKRPVDMRTQTAVIFLSSGTTGVAKGCEITQYNLIACISAFEKRMKFLKDFSDDVMTLNLAPWFHVMGFVNIYMILMSQSYSTVFLPRFDPKVFLSCIEKYKIISTSIPPPVVVFLSKTPLIRDYDLSSLRAIFCGAAPLKQETEDLVKSLFKQKLFILQGYGMSETTAGIIYGVAGNEAPGSTGEAEEGIYVKIVDENGKSLPAFKVGEVCCKGNRIMKGYLNNPKATAETIDKDGWLHTGDLGYYDEKNRFYIVDRLKELIKYKAFQVPPAELEGLLLSNPKIKDCGVIGIPDEAAGELPFAFVVKQPNVELSEDEVKNFVKENASNAKWLRGGVKFIEEIPKNPSGKILRRELRNLYKSMKAKL
jgi:acyl-CoA synthetase (AMP-forming)/AMP-acid ligase II